MLNWIIWSRTVFDIETVYLCWIELFEVELFLTSKFCTYALVVEITVYTADEIL